jgi:hypothetical protein
MNWTWENGRWVCRVGGVTYSLVGKLTGRFLPQWSIYRDGELLSIADTLQEAKDWVTKRHKTTLTIGNASIDVKFLQPQKVRRA